MGIRRTLGKYVRRAMGLDDLFMTGKEIPLNGNGTFTTGTDNAYTYSALCYACIRKKARDVAGVPLLFLTDPDDPDSIIEDPFNPVRRLFDKPHPALTREQFLQFFVTFLEMRGEVFTVFDNPARPSFMIPWIDPLSWRDHKAKDGNLTHWTYRSRNSGAQIVFDTDLIHHRYIDPARPYRGQSPLKAASKPYEIETGGDSLQGSLINQGGENGNIYLSEESMGTTEQETLLQAIRARRQGKGLPLRDLLLTGGVKPADPRFTETDLDLIAMQEPSRQKLTAVYGLTPALIYADDSPNYATFKERNKIYWTSEAIPLIRGIESAFDRFFVNGPGRFGVYVRFDLSKVEALQTEINVKLEAAKSLNDLRVPLAVINERLGLRLTLDEIPWANDVLVPSTLAPLSVIMQEYVYDTPAASAVKGVAGNQGEGGTMPPGPSLPELARNILKEARTNGKPQTQKEMINRATNPHFTIARQKRMDKLERELSVKWRNKMGTLKKIFANAVTDDSTPPEEMFKDLKPGIAETMVAVISPFLSKSAIEGTAAIQELLEADPPRNLVEIMTKAPNLGADTLEAIAERENFIQLEMAEGLWEELEAKVLTTQLDGAGVEDVRRAVKHTFNVSINRSVTIARTEVGTAYSVSRFHETKRAGYKRTEWLTALDENVRGEDPDDSFNHANCNGRVRAVGKSFPCGLTYPMEQSGAAGNVINCRCITIPVV